MFRNIIEIFITILRLFPEFVSVPRHREKIYMIYESKRKTKFAVQNGVADNRC